jgi:hypothetical protein
MSKQSKLVTRDANGRPLRWCDREGVIHAVEESPRADPFNVASCWTRCGAWNISRAEAWGAWDELTCQSCSAIEDES